MMAAQMAYQQAMMSMSQHGGGSQTGHGTPDRSSSPVSQHGQPHLAPPGGGFGGYYPPPQMSPYGWPGMMWGGGSPAPGSPMGPPPPGHSPGAQVAGQQGQGQEQGWSPPHIQYEGAPRSRGPSMYSENGGDGQGQDRDRSKSRDRDRGPVN